MSMAVEDFLPPSSSSAQRSNFQNPNPSVQKHPTDSGLFNNSFNIVNPNKLDFDCSNGAASAATTVRSSRKRHVKVKSKSGSTQPFDSAAAAGNTIDLMFNATSSGSVINYRLGQTGSGGNGEQQSYDEFFDFNVLRFNMEATNNSKLGTKIGSEEVHNSGNKIQSGNLDFVFGADEKADAEKLNQRGANIPGKLNGVDFVFGANINKGVADSNSSNAGHEYGTGGVALHVDDSDSGGTVGISGSEGFMKVLDDSHLVNSMLGLNLASRGSGKSDLLINKNPNAEEHSTSDCRRYEDVNFVFSANPRDFQTNLNFQKEESNMNADEFVSDGRGEMKLDGKVIFGSYGDSGTATEDLRKKDFGMSFTEIKSGDSVNRNVDSGLMFGNSKVNATFHIGNQNEKRSSFKGSRKPEDEMNILKSKGAESKQDSDVNFVHDGNFSFVFGNNLGDTLSGSSQAKVSDEANTANILDPIKSGTTNKINDSDGDSSFHSCNLFVFGSDKRNMSCGRSDATTLNQCRGVNLAGLYSFAKISDEVNKVPVFEEKKKSDTITKVYPFSNTETSGSDGGVSNGEPKSSGDQCYQDPLKTKAESIKDTVPSSSSSSSSATGLGFIPAVHCSEATHINGAGITGNFSFESKLGGLGTSFTGFKTPDINVANSFTSDMFPGLGRKLEFSKRNSVGQRKLKKTKAKLRQQSRTCPQSDGTHLSKKVPQSFEESPGCGSPMDVSPYWGTDCAPTSTDPVSSQDKVDDAVDTTEKLTANNIASSSATPGVDVPVRQRPNQKKYKMKIGCGSEFTTPKHRVDVCHGHEPTSKEHVKATDEETCDKWRKRGNQAYKSGDLSEAEVCYSKGINSIQHKETSEYCIEPLLLCYSNRAATRMALGRMREGLKDCKMAAALDPKFVKVNLRSANCHLLLGEVEDASHNYNKCLESGVNVCLDRRIAIEAADGLQKAQKVADYLKLSAELLQQKTYVSATNALGIIADALSISCYSEKLLNMKGEALLVLGKYKEVVQLCEQTQDSAEKNFATGVISGDMNADGYDCKNLFMLWRWNLMVKAYFHLGRLEMSLNLIEKFEQLRPTSDKIVGFEESLVPLSVTIRELLRCKNAGNEAFQGGKHTEAVEHYTAAISKSIESLSFAAVCFCNRAAAHQALGEIIDAIGDCNIAIALDKNYAKALSRRATLLEMIRDYKHAADDLQRFISILETQSGQNSQMSATPGKATSGSVKDLRRARRRLSSIEENVKKERPLDLYLILGLKPSDAASEVKKAYRKAALRHHPDKAGQVLARAESGSDGQQWKMIAESIQMDADKLFKMIGEAYAVLSDSTKRSKYDVEEEMWDDMYTKAGSSSRRASDFYSSPYESSWQESRKPYRNSDYQYWQDSRRSYHSSYYRW